MELGGIGVFGILCLLLFLGIPIAVSLGMTAIIALVMAGDFSSLLAFPQRLFGAVDSFPLMAIIFFMVAGELMVQGGISRRLVEMAKSFLYKLDASLVLITFVASAFFGALSGSGMATTAAIGNIMYPEMKRDGSYKKDWSLSVQAVGGILGPMIPPSIALVLYGTIANVSVGDLFIATVIPGLLICAILCLTGYFYAKKHGYGTNTVEQSRSSLLKIFAEGFWALISPFIILGGIYSGVFSPTESAAVACLYAIIVGKFVYKELTWPIFYKAIYNAMRGTATIMFLISCASFFGWVLTIQGIPQAITSSLIALIQSPYLFLVLANAIFLVAGMFVDTTTIILLCIPLLAPVAERLGINMIHFGVIASINLSLGQITPPFGACLFVAGSIDKSVKIESIFKHVLPFCVTTVIGIIIITYVPILSLWFK